MIWILKVSSVILYIILIIIIIIYLIISSRTRVCLVSKVNTPLCFNDWKCEGEIESASTTLTTKLEENPNCTLNTYQKNINQLCSAFTPDSNEFIQCISCVVYSRNKIYNCEPKWTSTTDTKLYDNYESANKSLRENIGSDFFCGNEKYCKSMENISFTYNTTSKTCTDKL